MKQYTFVLMLNLMTLSSLSAMDYGYDPDNPGKYLRRWGLISGGSLQWNMKAIEWDQVMKLPPLFQAIKEGDFSKVKEICDDVETYRSINEPWNGLIMPLTYALEKKQYEIADYLIHSGAKISFSMKVKLPNADILSDRIVGLWGGHFLERTELHLKLGNQELELNQIRDHVEAAYHSYQTYITSSFAKTYLYTMKPETSSL